MTVSIIATFHNCKKYVPACLDSVLAQTVSDWECVCVDNCSTDGAGDVLDAYAVKDNRFKIIHNPKNLGNAARSRNVGFNHITGDFVMFLDGDDGLAPTAIEMLLTALTQTGSDASYGYFTTINTPVSTPFNAAELVCLA